MKPITYLCFTLLSIAIQFCLMDFINENIQNDITVDHNASVLNNSSQVLKSINEKPHALFYRIERNKVRENTVAQKRYNNSTLPLTLLSTSTDYTSTIYDLFYDEINSTTDSALTTETFFTSVDLENVTEITFFDKRNTTKPTVMPKKKDEKDNCFCNLLYKYCDVNCCCDKDCSEREINLFKNCEKSDVRCFDYEKPFHYSCPSLLTCNGGSTSDVIHYLFCIDKVNLPDRRKINKNKLHTIDISKYLKWHIYDNDQLLHKFSKTPYELGNPVWLLRNGSLDVIKLPMPVNNHYCSRHKTMTFLQNERVSCYVKIKDLHMLQVLGLYFKTLVVSPLQDTKNSTLLNCTSLHCTNWTLLVCDDNGCKNYDEKLHEPSCSDSFCYNISTKLEYILYCNRSVITKVVVKLHIKRIPIAHQLVLQEVTVTFYMGNDSTEEIIEYSGNPGYIRGYPVIASFAEHNHTKFFYNRTQGIKKYFALPYNENGQCVSTNITHNILKFDKNQRHICRLTLKQKLVKSNITNGCLKMQEKIIDFLQLNNSIFISPVGNPSDVADREWIPLKRFNKSNIYGQYLPNDSKVRCHNLMTRFAFVFVFADAGSGLSVQYKILSADVEGTPRNVTFNTASLSATITLDTTFVDASAPAPFAYLEGGSAPHLDVHLPKNFFFPSQSSACKSTPTKFVYLSAVVLFYK